MKYLIIAAIVIMVLAGITYAIVKVFENLLNLLVDCSNTLESSDEDDSEIEIVKIT